MRTECTRLTGYHSLHYKLLKWTELADNGQDGRDDTSTAASQERRDPAPDNDQTSTTPSDGDHEPPVTQTNEFPQTPPPRTSRLP
eukprot:440420-Pyramimonas_sp.AAC.1